MHLVSGCPKLAQKQYKRRQDKVSRRVHLELCKRHGGKSSDRWYEHKSANVVENDEVELYWHLTIQRNMTVADNWPDIILVEKAKRKWTIIDIAVPCDFRTEEWKVGKYLDLAFEVKRIHHVQTAAILSVVIGALGTVQKRLIRSIELLGIGDIITSTTMAEILGTVGVLDRAINLWAISHSEIHFNRTQLYNLWNPIRITIITVKCSSAYIYVSNSSTAATIV